MVKKVVESVNQLVTRRMLIDQIVLAIKQKWLENGGHAQNNIHTSR